MNTEPGQLVKDGPIGDARGGVGDLQTMAKTDPQKVLADQAAAIAHAQGDMRALQAAAEKALADARAGAVGHMATHTTTVKGSEEQQRAAAGAQMQAVFTRTQQTVDGLLQPLSGNAVARWEAGVAQLSTEFENSLAQVKQKITERHSGVLGGLTELGDDVFGLPGWVTEDYDIAEARFGDGASQLITDISRDVNQVIEDCKKLIDQARKDIEAVVKSLPASLQSWAQGEASRLGQQLDQLSQKVDQTQKGLHQDLINRANGAVQQVREQVADLREQAKGLLGKIADAITEFLKNPAKAIVDGLLRILGIPPPSFWALVDKLGDVISGIAADPKKFANTLMAGVGQGFQQFFHNLPVHLGQALFQWLFSKLGEAGVQMPADFSIKSILTLVLEIMGITWARIKTILAKHIGPQGAEILDQAIKLITVLMEKGPQGVFEMIKEQLDPSMIIDAIKDAAIQYVMQTIITRVAARILMMLNPAGAILQAIEAIYRVIKWVIDNAARIFTLIESIVNGAQQILAGNTAGVANLVESSLVRLLVPVIDFLADYLGLGGIPDAIKKVILGLQKRVEAILDKVIGFLVEKAKALWQAIKSRVKGKDDKDDKKDEDTRTQEQKQADVAQAAEDATQLLKQKGATEDSVKKGLPPIKAKYKLAKLELVVESKDSVQERAHIHAAINPEREGPPENIATGMEEMSIDFTCTPSKPDSPMLDREEMKIQLAEGQEVLDHLTIAKWEANRDVFFKRKAEQAAAGKKNPDGRDPEGTKMQRAAKQNAIVAEAQQLMTDNPALSPEAAMAQAKAKFKGKVAAHKLDQFAGGGGTELSDRLGSGREDFAIGGAWKSRCALIEEKIKDIPPEVKAVAKMRVKITLDGVPVT